MPRVDLDALHVHAGPDRVSALLGPLGAFEGRTLGLRTLGANVETLAPGSSSSHRHWHSHVDEIVVVMEGHLTLVEDDGETTLNAGDIAVFLAGVPNGHCLRNDTSDPAMFFVVASRNSDDRCHYADADLIAEPDGTLRRADGTVA